jgi:hypothetical protein
MSEVQTQQKDTKKLSREEARKKVKYDLAAQREKDHEEIDGIFRFLEHKGQTLHFRLKKYQGDPYTYYALKDGERYRLKRFVVEHINKNVFYMKYKHLPSEQFSGVKTAFNNGHANNLQATMTTQEREHRCEFIPLEYGHDFADIMPSKIVGIEYQVTGPGPRR